MIVMLDFVAQRYGMLPSQLLTQGSSLDIYVAELAQRYHNRIAEEAQTGKSQKPMPEYTQEELLAKIEQVKRSRQ